jgi:hypothetical protein
MNGDAYHIVLECKLKLDKLGFALKWKIIPVIPDSAAANLKSIRQKWEKIFNQINHT